MSLIASSAIIEPTIPHSAPSTPASAHEGTDPGAGGSGNRSRSVTPSPTPSLPPSRSPPGRGVQKTDTCASNRSTLAQTSGTLSAAQVSDTR